MTHDRAVRFARLVSIGADDATLARDGFSELEIALYRTLAESAETVRAALDRSKGAT